MAARHLLKKKLRSRIVLFSFNGRAVKAKEPRHLAPDKPDKLAAGRLAPRPPDHTQFQLWHESKVNKTTTVSAAQWDLPDDASTAGASAGGAVAEAPGFDMKQKNLRFLML